MHVHKDAYIPSEFTLSTRVYLFLFFFDPFYFDFFNLQQYEGISKEYVQRAAFQPTGNYPAFRNWQQSREKK